MSLPDPNLMQLFRFTAADMEANRAGKMTADQAERLKAENENQTWINGCLLVVGAILVVPIACPLVSSLNINSTFQRIFDVIAIVLMVGLIGLLFFEWQRRRERLLTDAHLREIGVVTGTLQLIVNYGRNRIYEAVVEGKTFTLTEKQYTYLKGISEARGGETKTSHIWKSMDDQYRTAITCRVYYANASDTIMSVEMLEEDEELLADRDP